MPCSTPSNTCNGVSFCFVTITNSPSKINYHKNYFCQVFWKNVLTNKTILYYESIDYEGKKNEFESSHPRWKVPCG